MDRNNKIKVWEKYISYVHSELNNIKEYNGGVSKQKYKYLANAFKIIGLFLRNFLKMIL